MVYGIGTHWYVNNDQRNEVLNRWKPRRREKKPMTDGHSIMGFGWTNAVAATAALIAFLRDLRGL